MRAQAPADARVQQLESNLEEEGNAGAELRCGHGATHHPCGPLDRWQTSRECLRFLRWSHGEPLSESWVASLPLGWKRAYNGVRFWRWWVSQGNRPSGIQDLMYPPRFAGGGFPFRSALALRMAVAR